MQYLFHQILLYIAKLIAPFLSILFMVVITITTYNIFEKFGLIFAIIYLILIYLYASLEQNKLK